jgi:ABC-type multidrug transport system ATPase subunit
VIAIASVAARSAPLSRSSLSLRWGPGTHAVVGTIADGGPLLLAVLAGRERVKTGRVEVLGGSPRDAEIARQIALVPALPPLPEELRVDETFALAARLRGETPRPAAERLAVLGIEALAPRAVRSLAREEARAVAMAEALTSERVRVVLVDEPLASMDPRAVGILPERLRARASAGCAVIVATASVRDAGEICDDHVLLRQGAIAGQAASLDALSAFTPGGARMRIVVSDPQALAVALAREADVDAVARREREAVVVARGRDATALARAVGRAVLEAGVDLVEMRLEPPTLDEARSAAAGIAQATFEAARSRTLAATPEPS